jgi:tripartite-type tricarboxylate transporter receptor subunit TctC
MTLRRSRRAGIAALLLLAGLAVPPVQADVLADFYKGKTIAMVVGSSTGGGYDTMTRAVARFIGKHIPGNPTVVVRNMPGAGGITAMNYIYNAAERDGTVLALVQNNTPLEPLFGTKQARYDATRLNWLGTPSFEVAMVLLWHTVPVNSVEDLKSRETQMGASGANSTPAFYARLLNATLGTRMKLVNGYPGQTEALLAMERGELDGYPDLLTNQDDKLLMQVGFAPLALGRPLVMPPGAPADRIAAMRAALDATFADPEFLAEGERMGLAVNAPRSGAQLQDVIARAYQSPPRIIERLQKLNNP